MKKNIKPVFHFKVASKDIYLPRKFGIYYGTFIGYEIHPLKCEEKSVCFYFRNNHSCGIWGSVVDRYENDIREIDQNYIPVATVNLK